MPEDVKENSTSDNLVPSLFVDKNLLDCTVNSNKVPSKYFIIGDNNIFEDELMMPENNYVKFQMFATKRCDVAENIFVGDQADEEYCWTKDESSDDEVSTNEPPLDLHMQTTSHGIRGVVHCKLCNIIVPSTMKYLHTQEPSHRNQLYKSLNTTNDKNQTTITNNEETRSNGKLSSYRNNDISPPLVYTNNDNFTRTSDSAIVTDATNKYLSAFDANDAALATKELLNDVKEPLIDLDSFVYIKIANVYLKISVMSFNTLVVVGDGWSRYCFVCSTKIGIEELKTHIESRGHKENLSECKYVNIYEESLLRQMHLLYHCGTCNVLLSRKTMKRHMAWSSHTEEWVTAKTAANKATESGLSLIVATPQNETLYLQEELPKCKILYKVRFKHNLHNDRKHKIVMINDDVFKISFEHWHGVTTRKKTVLTCVICQCDIKNVTWHTGTQSHLECLRKPFNVDFSGELLRVVNKTTLHCITCNAEVANIYEDIFRHLCGKKHRKMYQAMKEISTNTDTFIDCEDETSAIVFLRVNI